MKWNAGQSNAGVLLLTHKLELMFLGEYRHSIDDKSRLTVPARYRQLLAEGGYITQGFDHNLMVLRTQTFEAMIRRLNQMSFTNAHVRELSRLLFGRAERVEPDGSGRILIPQFLREKVNLDGEVTVIGAGNYFEIWQPELWAKQNETLNKAQDNAQYFADLDLFAAES
ncbi:MAG: division/cell wall cluster transcriptional repressor MraZ [Anaerolineales bacterium]